MIEQPTISALRPGPATTDGAIIDGAACGVRNRCRAAHGEALRSRVTVGLVVPVAGCVAERIERLIERAQHQIPVAEVAAAG